MTKLNLMILTFGLLFGAPGLANADCDSQVPPFVEKITAQVIIVGEIHGTKEMPEFAAKLVCHYAKKKIPVLLGLELPTEYQTYLNTYHLSNGTVKDKEKLLGAAFWKFSDGRSSTGMFDLMEHARKLAKDGHAVFPFFFQASNDLVNLGKNKEDFNINNDLAMATSIYTRAINYKQHKIIILAGNKHARKADEIYSMASFLEKFTPVFSINFTYPGGKVWGCTGTPMVCGISALNPSAAQKQAGFDGIAALGELHPAPPVVGN